MAAMILAGLVDHRRPGGHRRRGQRALNQAGSLGTVAAVSAAGPERGPQPRSATACAAIFATAIQGPWCYLEFGDVDWCREPAAPRRRA